MSVAELEQEVVEVEELDVIDEEAPEEIQDAESKDSEPEEDEDEIVVSIGDEEKPSEDETSGKAAPEWVRQLRKTAREQERKIKEYERRFAEQNAPKQVELGAKPTLESFDYDSDRYESALADWFDKKRQADEQAKVMQDQIKKSDEAWKAKLGNYEESKSKLKVRDYEDVEGDVFQVFSTNQQGIIVHASKNPALLIYAIGKNDKRLKELSSIKDPVQFAWAAAQLEKELKVSTRKPTSAPERTVSGTASSNALDSKLEKLRKDADRTGDRSKVVAYLRQTRNN